MDDKKTWSDIERAVYRSRLQQYQFSSFVPSHFTFYKNILIFLGIPPLGDTYTNENTLVYVDVEGGVWEHMEIQKPIGDEENMNASSTHLYLSSKIFPLKSILKYWSMYICQVEVKLSNKKGS